MALSRRRPPLVEPKGPFSVLSHTQATSKHRNILLFVHLALSASLMATLIAMFRKLPHIDQATAGMVMLLTIIGMGWFGGWAEALIATAIASFGFLYYFLPPLGFRITETHDAVAFATFLMAAVAGGQATASSRRLTKQRDGLLALSPDPLCIQDLSGNFRNVNEGMVALLGWSEQELRSKVFVELVHCEDRSSVLAALQRSLDRRTAVEVQSRFKVREGGWRWLLWRMAANPEASWIWAAGRDITEQKRVELKLHKLARELMRAQEEERRRIARDLHDDITQRLALLGIELGLLRKATGGAGMPGLSETVSGLQADIAQLTDGLRDLSHSLHPGILEQVGLAAALEKQCREFTERHGIAADFSAIAVPDHMTDDIAIALYRITQEALRNVAVHAGASEVAVILEGLPENEISLSIVDNGKGFDVGQAKASSGLGLVSIEERASLAGGRATIDSEPDKGTRVHIQVHLKQSTEKDHPPDEEQDRRRG